MFSICTTLVSVGLEDILSNKSVLLEHSKGLIELQATAATMALWIPCDQGTPGWKSCHYLSRDSWP